jgi:hypothetical protein
MFIVALWVLAQRSPAGRIPSALSDRSCADHFRCFSRRSARRYRMLRCIVPWKLYWISKLNCTVQDRRNIRWISPSISPELQGFVALAALCRPLSSSACTPEVNIPDREGINDSCEKVEADTPQLTSAD